MPTRIYNSISEAAAALSAKPLHLAIGMFDGVHLGHHAVIESAVHSARRSGGVAAVLTFWPHPSRLFRPDNPVRLIMTPALKNRQLARLGVDAVITQTFDAGYASIEADAFLPRLKQALPHLTTIYVGENWRFGKGRRGDIAMLIAEARQNGISVVSAQRINQNGEPISSTRIRTYLEEGRMEETNALLGYTYFAEGTVTPGKQLGRTLGFPTLNVGWEPDLRPRFGVYAVLVSGAKASAPLSAVANYGLRPTVENATVPRLEIHVLGPCPFGEGDELSIEWLTFLRPEKKFDGVEALRTQIAADREAALTWFSHQ
ncbi:MAG: riboflavin biosynthesis protein RibF [Opitutaceae bacterium]